MAAHSPLKDLLKEDQEPFHLSNYIADKRSKLSPDHLNSISKRPKQQQQLLKKHQPSFPVNLCKNACFFSSDNHFTKSPLLLSPLHKSPVNCSSPRNALFLHVPAKTAAMLLEASIRIQNTSDNKTTVPPKSKSSTSSGFGLLGSVIRRITHRTRRKLQLQQSLDVVGWAADSVNVDHIDDTTTITKRELETDQLQLVQNRTCYRFTNICSDDHNKSVNFSSSSSSSSSSSTINSCSCSYSRECSDDEKAEDIGSLNTLDTENFNAVGDDFTFCLSPLTPFNFGLYNTTPCSPERRPVSTFSSPATSPPPHFKFEANVISAQKFPVKCQEKQVDEEDEKQNSPVCVLDPPFDDDEEEECSRKEDKEFNPECSSCSFVQRTKQHLLQKLRKFEKFADLDPIELDYAEAGCGSSHDEKKTYILSSAAKIGWKTDDVDGFLAGMSTSLESQEVLKPGMKRLVSDLIFEEGIASSIGDYELVAKRVCKRLESWVEIEPRSTIEMMVGFDLKREYSDWKNIKDDISEVARAVEMLIFSVLVSEVVDELMFAAW